jgi:NAD(P)H-nitrite reductase large subunit
MEQPAHHVIIGNGVAGNHAATVIRSRAPDDRITIMTVGALLFYDRYQLPQILHGKQDWRTYLVHPPSYYEQNRIAVRRSCRVTHVDAEQRVLTLAHRETVRYDTLLIASGGGGYLPATLIEFRPLFHYFHTFRAAMATARALPEGSVAIILGGDILGLDIAYNLVETGRKVILIPHEQSFWPHKVAGSERARLFEALAKSGIEIAEDAPIERIEATANGAQRKVTLAGGCTLTGNVVMPFYGLAPSLDFIAGSGVDIERGLLVSPELRTTNPHILAAGDVCQIWSAEDNAYRFYYGWRNVKAMGEIAARNMTGASDSFRTFVDETLTVNGDGKLHSSFWDYD